MSDQPKGLQLGERIYVESLMTPQEWKQRCLDYPATSINKNYPKFFNSDFNWRYGMGSFLSPEEVVIINTRIDEVKRKAGI